MFAALKTLAQGPAKRAALNVLTVAALAAGLFASQAHSEVTEQPCPHGHVHAHHHTHAVEAFSFGDLLGFHEITTENFPVEPVAELARRVAKELQPGVLRPIHIVTVSRRERTPVAAVSRNASMCVVILNTNPDGWAVWNRFFGRVPESERMNVVELAIAHEVGHCAERELNGTERVAEGFNPLEGEVFADIFATLYAQQYMGDRAAIALATLKDLRAEFARSEPTHATGERLKALQPKFEDLQQKQLSPVLMAQTAGELRSTAAQ